MRRFLVLTALLSLFGISSAPAQILSVYGTFSPVHASGVETGAVYSAGGYHEQTTSFWANGVGGGVTVNFLPLPVVSLGLDFRGSTRPGTVGADMALVGLKLGVHPPVIRIKPYVQGSVGYLATRTLNVSTPAGSTSGTIGGTFGNQYLAYEVLGGVDYPLMHFVDYRVIEIGGGKAMWNDSNHPGLFTINTGIVLHF